jgi:hypothetical protein
MKTSMAVMTRRGAEKAAGLLLMFMQSSLLAMLSYYCGTYFSDTAIKVVVVQTRGFPLEIACSVFGT